jgi:prepilin-type N-terminal cleavage/methylation domain-containing protein
MCVRNAERGISLIEILVALTILSIGLLALAGTSANVTRMIGQGRWNTAVMGFAEGRVDMLRAAARDSASCGSIISGSASLPGGLTEHWNVSAGIRSVAIAVIVTGRGARADTISTVVPCL